MARIGRIVIRKILDSRGNPTVEVCVSADGATGCAAAPSGASTGTYEVVAIPSKGIDAAILSFRRRIVPRLLGMDCTRQADVDAELRAADGTDDLRRVGGNLIVATSLAVARTAAEVVGQPLFRYVGGAHAGEDHLPYPMGNLLGGGAHAVGGTILQEFMALAQGLPSSTVFANGRAHALVKETLRKRFPNAALGKGDEGAWVAPLDDDVAMGLVRKCIATTSRRTKVPMSLSLDFAATEFFRDGRYRYRKRSLRPSAQRDFVEQSVRSHNIASVEDPLEEGDFTGFAELTDRIGDDCLVIGDDLFVTNVERLQQGIAQGAANAILIKPNQVGTLTDTARTVRVAQAAGYACVLSHRSGETEDTTIAHLAVAFGAVAIKTGAVGGERTAKLNELLRIEELLLRPHDDSRGPSHATIR